jgi:adhesin transport system membrane fusion protein
MNNVKPQRQNEDSMQDAAQEAAPPAAAGNDKANRAADRPGSWRASFRNNPLLWTVSALPLVFIGWAAAFPLDVASYAHGQIIPAGQLKRVQHLEGGIVKNILVSEGGRVKAGDVLVELENVAPDSEAGDLGSRAASLEIKSLRLSAQLAGKDRLALPAELVKRQPNFAREAVSAFEAQRQRFAAMVQAHSTKISQRQAEIRELGERVTGLKARRKLVADQVRISEEAMAKKLTNEYEHLQLKKEQAGLEADISTASMSRTRAEGAIAEAQAELLAFRHSEEESLRKDLETTETELASLRERLKKPSDSQDRTAVRAPAAGTVMQLFVKNKGAVVTQGGTVATLVPEGEALVVEAKLPITDIGFVKPGQPARLTVSSGSRSFAPIGAKVTHISPDAVADEKAGSYYVVRLAPDEAVFRQGDETFPLRPGVQITSAIISGQRSVLSLLVDPFWRSGIQPLSER